MFENSTNFTNLLSKWPKNLVDKDILIFKVTKSRYLENISIIKIWKMESSVKPSTIGQISEKLSMNKYGNDEDSNCQKPFEN